MEIIQVLIVIFAAFALSRVILRLRDGRINLKEFIFWTIIWVLIIIVAVNPEVSKWISTTLGIARGVDLLIYLSIILLFYLMFRMYVKMDTMNQEISRVVRELAIDKKRKK